MGKAYTRQEVLARLHKELEAGRALIFAGAGTGISGKFEEAGGADIIGIYNSGVFRMAGAGSLAGLLPYGDANRMVIDLFHQVFPIIKETPLIAGICGTDPFTVWPPYLQQLMDLGFSGIMTFPTVGLIDGKFRANIEETGFGFAKEAAVIRLAREMNIFTIGYCFNEEEAKMIAEAGADILACHMVLTSKGTIGAKTIVTMDDAVDLTNRMIAVGKKIKPDIIPITHGGPIAVYPDVKEALARTEAVGFLGASTIERIPVETAITECVKELKTLKVTWKK